MGKACSCLVIGAGVAGLSCAEVLLARGFAVTIYEKDSVAGGFVNLIPERRMKRTFIQNMVDRVRANGGQIHFHTPVDLANLPPLLAQFDHIFVAVGTQKARQYDFPAKNQVYALEFLRNDIRAPRVAVCGGGNVALDCVIAARERGCETTLYYRRQRENLRAHQSEIDHAEKIGVKFVFGVTDFDVPCDLFVVAIGLEPDLPQSLVDLSTQSRPRVHIIGDACIGASTIAAAVKHAREIASAF